MEVESWILADKTGFCKYFHIPEQKLPGNPDNLEDPKDFLIGIIRKHCKNRDYRDSIVPQKNSGAIVGPAYNPELIQFVRKAWNVRKARGFSPSLDRTLKALDKLRVSGGFV